MSTCFALSSDGVRIAYDISGTGFPLLLLHGGSQTRLIWHTAGYVERLNSEFKVVAIDLRGSGESDKPSKPTDYAIDKHCQDILAVADACKMQQFALWGYSLGGNIGRYLAAQSPRVASFIMMGVSFGLGASGDFRRFIVDFRDHWLAGSRNDRAMAGIRKYETALKGSKVQVQIVEGLDHAQELTLMDKVLPVMLAFTRANTPELYSAHRCCHAETQTDKPSAGG
jgi:pimeloyl-ACP methyl ester carboxylesterase